MAKLPYMQFYPADYQADVRCLSLSAQGAWMQILCSLWRSPKRGARTLNMVEWSREIGCTIDELHACLFELQSHNICEFSDEKDSKLTIISRRMKRDERVRRCAAKRQQYQRDRFESRSLSRPRHGDVTPESQKSDIKSQNSELRRREEKTERMGNGRRERPPLLVPMASPCSEEFERFWNVYPRKVGRGAAWKSWCKARSRPAVEVLVRAVEEAKRARQWQEGFIPNPATWINQERWHDEPSPMLTLGPVPSAYAKDPRPVQVGEPCPAGAAEQLSKLLGKTFSFTADHDRECVSRL